MGRGFGRASYGVLSGGACQGACVTSLQGCWSLATSAVPTSSCPDTAQAGCSVVGRPLNKQDLSLEFVVHLAGLRPRPIP